MKASQKQSVGWVKKLKPIPSLGATAPHNENLHVSNIIQNNNIYNIPIYNQILMEQEEL